MDEKKIVTSLPIYVCDNADSMPSTRICETDFIALLRKLNALESNDNNMQAQLDRLLDASRASFVVINKIATQSHQNFPPLMGGQGHVPSFLQKQGGTTTTQSQMIPSRFTSRLFTQTSDGNIINTESDLSESEGGAGVFSDTDYTHVKTRNTVRLRKRARQATSPPQPAPYSHVAASGLGPNVNGPPPRAATANNAKPSNRPLMIGASNSTTMNAAAKLTLSKVVYRISNVGGGVSEKDMTEYLKLIGVRVLTCFDRTSAKARINNNKSFRICILAVDKHKLLNESNWDIGITIQAWIFPPHGENITNRGAVPPPSTSNPGNGEDETTVVGSPTNNSSCMEEGGQFTLASDVPADGNVLSGEEHNQATFGSQAVNASNGV